jgi:uncharacterized membrane protein YgcG
MIMIFKFNIMRRVYALRVLSLVMIISLWPALYAYERIIYWDSDITVNKNGSMLVTEELMIKVEGVEIRRGIVREFPTKYHTSFGLRSNLGFEVKQVLLDGYPIAYKVVDAINGVRLFIGKENERVQPGVRVYTITYETTKQIGFFDKHDELYWNVTGQGWRFAIEAVHVRVHIPQTMLNGKKLASEDIHAEGYTGVYGSKEKDYVASVDENGVVHFITTRLLNHHEGATIVVTWPKGVVQQGSLVWDYIRDNLHIIVLMVAFLFVLCWFLWSMYITRKSIKYGTIIPLFYPPHDIDPGALRYILKMRYQSQCLASLIVHMAVRGLLVIEHVKGNVLTQAHYVLKKRTDVHVEPTELENRLLQVWFKKAEALPLKQENADTVSAGKTLLARYYERLYDIKCFDSHYDYVSVAGMVTLGSLLIALFSVSQAYYDFWFWALLIGQVILHVIMLAVLPAYTQDGQKLKEEIEGFKMFLSTTEEERLKLIGTPPTRTPELYERYLPYAIALDVEEQWSQQFAPIFKQLETAGNPYQPVWFYAGHPFVCSDLIFLNSSLGRSLNDAVYSTSMPISSSATRPGSSSGSGGSGYSGGGGGGGGGGGW